MSKIILSFQSFLLASYVTNIVSRTAWIIAGVLWIYMYVRDIVVIYRKQEELDKLLLALNDLPEETKKEMLEISKKVKDRIEQDY